MSNNREEKLKKIRESITELYGDCVEVSITVNSRGIKVFTQAHYHTEDYCFVRIDGKTTTKKLEVEK